MTKQLTPIREAVHRLSSAIRGGPDPGIRLVDISKYQSGPINYAAMFDPANPGYLDGIVVKATEGTSIIDSLYSQHWQGAVSHAPVMVYHFFRSNLSGSQQADKLLSTIDTLRQVQQSTVVWLDIETADGVSNTTRINRAYAFLSIVESELPGRVGMYSSPYLWNQLMTINGTPPLWTNQFWQWPAHWTSASQPALPTGWTWNKVRLWQYGIWDNYSWCAPVPGMTPDVDVDWGYFDSREHLADFVGIIPDPPPPSDLEARVTALEAGLSELTERVNQYHPTAFTRDK